MLMRVAAQEYGWDLNYGGIALMLNFLSSLL